MEVAGLVLGTFGYCWYLQILRRKFRHLCPREGLQRGVRPFMHSGTRVRLYQENIISQTFQLSLQQIRLLIWGESLGLVPREGNKESCYNAAIERPDIRPAIEASLCHLRNLLAKVDVITG